MRKVVAIVGMAGSGKSEVSGFRKSWFYPVRFGDITDSEMKKRSLDPVKPASVTAGKFSAKNMEWRPTLF